MCGIAAATGAGADELVASIVEAMHHRGPDARGLTVVGSATIGMTRLAVMDPQRRSDQPMGRGRFSVVFNGELYNHAELRRELEAAGFVFTTCGDTEVLVNALVHWGVIAACQKFSGMFAFVAVDGQTNEVWFARDRFGIKPLYWTLRRGGIAICSESRHLRSSASGGIDRRALAEFFRFGSPITRSIHQDVFEMEPGTVVALQNGQMRQVRYAPAHDFGDRTDVDPALALRSSIEQHLVADRDVALWLSGGFDSAILLAAARDLGRDVVALTLSTGMNDAELARAAATAKHFGVVHEIVAAGPREVVTAFPEFIDAMDQPSIDGFNTFLMSQATQLRGCAVALSGLGGDEVLGGYGYYRSRPAFDVAAKVTRMLPSALQRSAVDRLARRLHQPPQRLAALLTSHDLESRHAASRTLFGAGEVFKMTGEYCNIAATNDSLSDRLRLARLDFDRYLRPTLLRDADVFSMACSVELRVPMLDPAFVGAVLGATAPPTKIQLADAWDDAYLRELAVAPKLTFSMPWKQWLPGILAKHENRLSAAEPWGCDVDPNVARALFSATQRGEHDSLLRVWAFVVLANWIERTNRGGSDVVVWRSAA